MPDIVVVDYDPAWPAIFQDLREVGFSPDELHTIERINRNPSVGRYRDLSL